MEAIIVRSLRVISLTVLLVCPLQVLQAGSARTQNFIVSAPTTALATEIAHEAERFRKELAISWLGHELPAWKDPCPVQAKVNPRLGAGGATSFLFETEQRQFARPVGDGLFQAKPAGRPFGWEMSVQGSRERILDSVLPHEVTHTIFATYFGRPLPRWADEGACTTVEHESEKQKQHRMLYEFLTTERGIPFNQMFSMTEYPKDILPLYSQGYSLARFLIQQGGRRKFVDYIGDGLDSNNWTETTRKHYGFDSISDLQVTWLGWVRDGGRRVPNRLQASATLIASQSGSPRSTAQPAARVASTWAPMQNDAQVAPATANFDSVRPSSHRPQSSPVEGRSWYAQQKSRAQVAAGKQVATVQAAPRGDKPRVVSRANREDSHREVILEWGKPSAFLNPTLASREGAVERR